MHAQQPVSVDLALFIVIALKYIFLVFARHIYAARHWDWRRKLGGKLKPGHWQKAPLAFSAGVLALNPALTYLEITYCPVAVETWWQPSWTAPLSMLCYLCE